MQNDNLQARDVAQRELRDVLASTEALLAALGNESGDAIDELRVRLTTTIADVKRHLGPTFVDSARDKIARARDTVTQVNDFVTGRPWTSVAIAAGIGLLAGMILKD